MTDPWDAILVEPTARAPRTLETREQSSRRRSWVEPTMLPDPTPQDGYVFKWVRTATRNVEDKTNYQKRIREGWEPVPIEEQPKFRLLADPNSRYKDNIEIGGLLLCKTPKEFVEQRNKHFADLTQSQTEAVDNNFMRQSDARMPLFKDRSSSTSFGKGK